MPVSTDGVLLGAWSQAPNQGSILDIGTGTGLLALMCAQRNPNARITAIDISDTAIRASRNNIAASPWTDRLAVVHDDVLTFARHTENRYAAIICNPPYFNSGEKADKKQRAIARHTDHLPHTGLLAACQLLLTEKGIASFILPTYEAQQMITAAGLSGWHLVRCCEVKTTPSKPVTRYLFELSRGAPALPASEPTSLTIHSGNQYSDDFIALTRDFYLKM